MGAKVALLVVLAAAVVLVVVWPEPGPGPASSTVIEPQPAGVAPRDRHTERPYRFGEVQAMAPPIVDGKTPVVRRIPTDRRYVFITIDDGAVRDSSALRLIRESGLSPTLFLTQKYVTGHDDYFRAIRDKTGADIQNHTLNHPNLLGKPYAVQRGEICGSADTLAKEFGRRPTLFRPPFGNVDETTRRAAADCGVKAIVLWTVAVNDGVVQFQAGDRLSPGDIVLMHFRKTFVEDYTAFVDQARRDDLTPVPLPDFLG